MPATKRSAVKAPPPVDPVLGRYIMHTRQDTVRNRLWALAAVIGLLAAAVAAGLYLQLLHALQDG